MGSCGPLGIAPWGGRSGASDHADGAIRSARCLLLLTLIGEDAPMAGRAPDLRAGHTELAKARRDFAPGEADRYDINARQCRSWSGSGPAASGACRPNIRSERCADLYLDTSDRLAERSEQRASS